MPGRSPARSELAPFEVPLTVVLGGVRGAYGSGNTGAFALCVDYIHLNQRPRPSCANLMARLSLRTSAEISTPDTSTVPGTTSSLVKHWVRKHANGRDQDAHLGGRSVGET